MSFFEKKVESSAVFSIALIVFFALLQHRQMGYGGLGALFKLATKGITRAAARGATKAAARGITKAAVKKTAKSLAKSAAKSALGSAAELGLKQAIKKK